MMKRCCSLLALALLAATPAVAGSENQMLKEVEQGTLIPFEVLRNRVVSQVKGDYIGADIDRATRIYRFKFLVDGSVVNVDVDGRTGQRVRRSSF